VYCVSGILSHAIGSATREEIAQSLGEGLVYGHPAIAEVTQLKETSSQREHAVNAPW
jgi:hypothetical protein